MLIHSTKCESKPQFELKILTLKLSLYTLLFHNPIILHFLLNILSRDAARVWKYIKHQHRSINVFSKEIRFVLWQRSMIDEIIPSLKKNNLP